MSNRKLDVVIRVDGGICSQIAFVALGLYLVQRGRSVLYDLEWYRTNGLDMNGKFARNWDFPKAFPSVPCPECQPEELSNLPKYALRSSADWQTLPSPCHVVGYVPNVFDREVIDALMTAFSPELDDFGRAWERRAKQQSLCAVHVRRGDLSAGNSVYGVPPSAWYFETALRIVRGLDPDVRFYFFSDEPAWVRLHLLPKLPFAESCEVVEANGSDRGYVDLYLMSLCRYIVSSHGSLGIYAAMLSRCLPTLFLSRYRALPLEVVEHVVYLKDSGSAITSRSLEKVQTSVWIVPEHKQRGLWRPVYKIWKHMTKVLEVR